MAVNTTLEIVESYQGLLIMQYLNKPNASAFIKTICSPAILPQTSVQEINFSLAPTTGTWVLSYNGNNTATINWNDTSSTIQSRLQALTGLSQVTVTGSIASLSLAVTFTGVIAPALSLIVVSNTLHASSTAVDINIVETDQVLPLAVMNGYNLSGANVASGAQLDVLGKYVGANRTGQGFNAPITLDDADYLQLIKMAIAKNSSGSDLSTIVNFLFQFFPNEIFVYDNLDMTMTYIISQGIGSNNLVQLFVNEGLLPSPMAVEVTVFNPPVGFIFSFRTVAAPTTGAPFNTTALPQIGYWLSSHDLLS